MSGYRIARPGIMTIRKILPPCLGIEFFAVRLISPQGNEP
jgi:hypothetical protein